MMDAQRKGLKVETFNRDSLAHDVDLPEDLTYLNGQLPGWITPPADDPSEDVETLSLTK